jgi:DUF971 family protein
MAEPGRPLLPILGPDPYAIRAIRLVGRYAVGVDWQDGHGSIYPFDALREACACAECEVARSAGRPAVRGEGATWPETLTREARDLRIRWSDGHESLFESRALRAGCRCARCTGGH